MLSALAARIAAVRAGGSTTSSGNSSESPKVDDVPVAALTELRKRQHEFAYLRGCLAGEHFAFNSALLGAGDIESASTAAGLTDLTPLWYRCLLSLGRLLTSLGKPDQADTLLRSCCQLMAEVDHAAGDTVIPDTLLALASVGGANDTFPDSVRVRPGEPVKPVLHTVRKGVVYEILLPAGAAPLPFDGLSFKETAISLLTALYDVYDRLVSHPRATDAVPNFAEATSKMDARVRRQFVKPISECLVRACAMVSRRALLEGVPRSAMASEGLTDDAVEAVVNLSSPSSRSWPASALERGESPGGRTTAPLVGSLHSLASALAEAASEAETAPIPMSTATHSSQSVA